MDITITTGELIKELAEFDPDTPVVLVAADYDGEYDDQPHRPCFLDQSLIDLRRDIARGLGDAEREANRGHRP
jgi:hypothetical protein